MSGHLMEWCTKHGPWPGSCEWLVTGMWMITLITILIAVEIVYDLKVKVENMAHVHIP